MVQGKYLYYGDDLSEVFKIRRKVFIDEQGIAPEEEFDDYDNLAVHALVYDNTNNKKAVATGRVYHDGENYRIGRIAVLKEERGKYYGDFVVRLLVDKAFLAGAEEVIINAQVNAIKFYEKIGFIPYGDIFDEAGIEHVVMKVKLNSICKKCDKK
ncbi:MAG: GNAT family N-acetyltransferase [Anaerocolumna sp.]